VVCWCSENTRNNEPDLTPVGFCCRSDDKGADILRGCVVEGDAGDEAFLGRAAVHIQHCINTY
jgi:hypothetical protein